MTVHEIEIKQNLIALPPDQGRRYRKAIYDSGWMQFNRDEKFPPGQAVNVKDIEYAIITWYGEDGEVKHFGLPVDQEGLFKELLQISEDLIKRKVDREVEVKTSHFNMAMKQAIETATETTIKYIANLPWWRRLFKAF